MRVMEVLLSMARHPVAVPVEYRDGLLLRDMLFEKHGVTRYGAFFHRMTRIIGSPVAGSFRKSEASNTVANAFAGVSKNTPFVSSLSSDSVQSDQ